MRIIPNGEIYAYCPGKSTWEPEIVQLYESLVITANTGIMYRDGGLAEQEDWWIKLCSWFLPTYNDRLFWSRVRNILGDGSKTEKPGGSNRRPTRQDKR